MDSLYFALIEAANETVRLSTAVALNANYKEAIDRASRPLLADACRKMMEARLTLNEIINRQEYAHVQSMPA